MPRGGGVTVHHRLLSILWEEWCTNGVSVLRGEGALVLRTGSTAFPDDCRKQIDLCGRYFRELCCLLSGSFCLMPCNRLKDCCSNQEHDCSARQGAAAGWYSGYPGCGWECDIVPDTMSLAAVRRFVYCYHSHNERSIRVTDFAVIKALWLPGVLWLFIWDVSFWEFGIMVVMLSFDATTVICFASLIDFVICLRSAA